MSTETTPVEKKIEGAGTQQETVTPTQTKEVDYEAELKKKDDEIVRIREERENYRKGMLKAKGKIPAEDDNSGEEDLDTKVNRKVQEALLATREANAQAEKDKFIADMAKKNKELTLALKNRNQVMNTSGQGSNEDKPEVKVDKVLSTEQLNALRAKGFTDKMIEDFKANLNKVSQAPK